MATPPVPHHRFRDTRVSRFLQARWRLLFSVLVCVVLVLFLPDNYRLVSRLLIGWDAGVALYLALVMWMIVMSDPGRVRRESALQDEGRITIPVLIVTAALASLGAIIFWLRTASESETVAPRVLALLFLTTLLSWVFVHIMFALHYAHEYYAEHRGKGGGLRFPGGGDPTYWDFVYFAFAIGTATAVSDVPVTSRNIRQTVTAHGMVSFIFNVTMIALTVSIAGDAVRMK
ncbi:MAG: DUF1345 domain-containing protein [Methyloceanibacter sp.]|uniref:DUF1345 domain-containing protein n=1 Tax=Methyloceanibacter sp. TaxID=1965321 RepID=UPI003D6D853F